MTNPGEIRVGDVFSRRDNNRMVVTEIRKNIVQLMELSSYSSSAVEYHINNLYAERFLYNLWDKE